nr:hypothetical protein CFP56_58834 [Quercus suber]
MPALVHGLRMKLIFFFLNGQVTCLTLESIDDPHMDLAISRRVTCSLHGGYAGCIESPMGVILGPLSSDRTVKPKQNLDKATPSLAWTVQCFLGQARSNAPRPGGDHQDNHEVLWNLSAGHD